MQPRNARIALGKALAIQIEPDVQEINLANGSSDYLTIYSNPAKQKRLVPQVLMLTDNAYAELGWHFLCYLKHTQAANFSSNFSAKLLREFSLKLNKPVTGDILHQHYTDTLQNSIFDTIIAKGADLLLPLERSFTDRYYELVNQQKKLRDKYGPIVNQFKTDKSERLRIANPAAWFDELSADFQGQILFSNLANLLLQFALDLKDYTFRYPVLSAAKMLENNKIIKQFRATLSWQITESHIYKAINEHNLNHALYFLKTAELDERSKNYAKYASLHQVVEEFFIAKMQLLLEQQENINVSILSANLPLTKKKGLLSTLSVFKIHPLALTELARHHSAVTAERRCELALNTAKPK